MVQDKVIAAGGWSWAWFEPASTPKPGKACAEYFRSAKTRGFVSVFFSIVP